MWTTTVWLRPAAILKWRLLASLISFRRRAIDSFFFVPGPGPRDGKLYVELTFVISSE